MLTHRGIKGLLTPAADDISVMSKTAFIFCHVFTNQQVLEIHVVNIYMCIVNNPSTLKQGNKLIICQTHFTNHQTQKLGQTK